MRLFRSLNTYVLGLIALTFLCFAATIHYPEDTENGLINPITENGLQLDKRDPRYRWQLMVTLSGISLAVVSIIGTPINSMMCINPAGVISQACAASLAVTISLLIPSMSILGIGILGMTVDHIRGIDHQKFEQLGLTLDTPTEEDLENYANHPTIRNLTRLEMNAGKFLRQKYLNEVTQAVVYFSTDLGHHLALGLPGISADDLAKKILDSTPNVPSGIVETVKKSKLSGKEKITRALQTEFMTLTWKNGDEKNSREFLEAAFKNFDLRKDAKNFLNAITDGDFVPHTACSAALNPSAVSSSNYNTSVSINGAPSAIAFIGQWYLNTYGGIDPQCATIQM